MNFRRLRFWGAYAVLLTALTIAGLEFMSSFVVPPWPERELRPIVVSHGKQLKTLQDSSLSQRDYNSWGLRDRERSLLKPADIDFRSVLVGDSFLEGSFVDRPLATHIEDLWTAAGRRDMEAVSLGIAATGPPQYYYRIKNFALSLQPDALVLLFFAGNDFVPESLGSWPPAIAERPQLSWLGAVAPHLTWLIVNRLGLSEFQHGNKAGDFDTVNDILRQPRDRRADAIVRFLKQNYYPDMDEAVIRGVIGRADDGFWDAFEKRDHDQEFLQSWLLSAIVGFETGTWPTPLTPEECERSVDPAQLESTMSWLIGAAELAHARGVKFLVAMVPSPAIDPQYAAFWSPWPRFRSFPMARLAWHRALRAALAAKGLPVADLEDDLKGIAGTYRLSDGHWTEFGTDIAARRLATELMKMRLSEPGL
jgi:SGNH hydrolase-like domain, acetyltransferase AlgX